MVEVRFVDVSSLGVRPPADRVRMVIAQPYLPKSAFTRKEPYSLTEEARARQLEVLGRTMDIASASADAGGVAQFTIVPEYCIPGLGGVDFVEERLRAGTWANGTVLIGGLDGVSKAEYSQLLGSEHTRHDEELNGLARVADDQWLNCAITWVKSGDGKVVRWVQPKLWPAWPEASSEEQRMFKGGSVYLFRGQRTNGETFIFGTLVCFDWIAPPTPSTYERILEETHREANEAQLPLTWLFVIQRNGRPSHHDFLNNVVSFFRDRSYPNATRGNACLVFANTAGLEHPGYCAQYGSTSLILGSTGSFMTSGARPTLSNQGFRYREENPDVLRSGRCTDVFLRERGECVHVLDQINPSWVLLGAAGRSYAVENAEVHAALGGGHVLAPGGGVPAAVKWANDVLDQTSAELPRHGPALGMALEEAHKIVIEALRRAGPLEMTDLVRLSTGVADDDVDAWDVVEGLGLRHVLYTLRVLGAGDRLESVGKAMVHGVVAFGSGLIDVVAIRGVSHEECIRHLEKRHLGRQRRHLLLVSRDEENTGWDPKYGNFLKAGPQDVEAGPRFMDVASPTYHVGYQDVLGFLREADELSDIERRIEASAGG